MVFCFLPSIPNIVASVTDNIDQNLGYKTFLNGTLVSNIVGHCCYAMNTLIDQPWKIMSIARRDWAAVGHSI